MEKQMNNFYEKLKEMPEEKFLFLQKLLGFIAGVLCWLALRLGNLSEDKLLAYLFLAVFLAFTFGTRSVAKKIERELTKFQVFQAIGLGVGIVIFVLFCFVLSPHVFGATKGTGLIELIFNIPV